MFALEGQNGPSERSGMFNSPVKYVVGPSRGQNVGCQSSGCQRLEVCQEPKCLILGVVLPRDQNVSCQAWPLTVPNV